MKLNENRYRRLAVNYLKITEADMVEDKDGFVPKSNPGQGLSDVHPTEKCDAEQGINLSDSTASSYLEQNYENITNVKRMKYDAERYQKM